MGINQTNEERALKYLAKVKMLGAPGMELEILSSKDVYLSKVPDGTGILEIPDFISGITPRSRPNDGNRYKVIKIPASIENWANICSGMLCGQLTVISDAKPYCMNEAFSNMLRVKEIDFSSVNLSNAEMNNRIFKGCEQLRKLRLKNISCEMIKSLPWSLSKCYNLKEVEILSCTLQEASLILSSIKNWFNLIGKFQLGSQRTLRLLLGGKEYIL